MRLFLLSCFLFNVSFVFAQSNSTANSTANSSTNSPTTVIQEPKPKYTADLAKEEKKLSKTEKAKLKKWRAPRKPEKSIEDQIKDEDQSDLTPPE